MKDALSEQVAAILGEPVLVQTEDGVSVFYMNTCQLTMLGRAPKSLTAEWVVKAIERKTKTAEQIKQRREQAAQSIRAYLTAKGIKSDGMSIYFTSTGFSVENLFHDGMEEAKRILAECRVEYKRLEYSGAHWVVRVIL